MYILMYRSPSVLYDGDSKMLFAALKVFTGHLRTKYLCWAPNIMSRVNVLYHISIAVHHLLCLVSAL